MSDQDVIRLAREGVEAFGAGDWTRARVALAPDTVYYEPSTGRCTTEVEQSVQAAQAWKAAFPDAKGTITNELASGTTAVLEIVWEGTHTGPLEAPGGTIPATGRHVRLEAVQVVTVANEKVTETRHYFDLWGMLQQLGVLPTPGTPATP